MTNYIHFTDDQKEQARQTDLVSLLESQGERVKRSGSEYEWKDGSQKVTIRGNLPPFLQGFRDIVTLIKNALPGKT